jgi:hypothetical protein
MPSTLVEFIKNDEILDEELEEFERELEKEEIVDMNFLYKKIYFPSFINLLSSSLIMIIKKNKKQKTLICDN